jgi:transketolase
MATRAASGAVLDAIMPALPTLVGGSADLAPSTKTLIEELGSVGPGQFEGRNLHFGVREHAMGAILNGMALHGGVRPFGATFLVFSDYMRPSIRLAAIMGLPVVYVFTHDSIFVGEDGPTHQPVEHLASLRAIPKLVTLRPADAPETAAAWEVALKRREGPTALVLTRQGVPILDRTVMAPAEGLRRGGYVLVDEEGPELILVGTGSEVSLALEARRRLADEGVRVRVVSLPSWELFEAQDEAYRDRVLLPGLPKVAVEAGVPLGWERYVGRRRGRMVGIESQFGASAPAKVMGEQYGLTADAIVDAAQAVLAAVEAD